MQDAHTEPDNSEKRQECNGNRYFAGELFVPLAASCPTQIIQHLACERARYHVSVDKMHCRQRMFLQNGATLKVHVQPVGGKQWVRREATILLRHPPSPTHSLATKMRHSIRYLLDGPQLRKENSGCVGVFGPAGTPARVVFSHRTQPGHSPRHSAAAAASPNQF